MPGRAPSATYRLQLGGALGFAEAAALSGYLDALGITHAYISPPFRALAGSAHGYDVVDHGSLSPELGGEAGFAELAARLQESGLGILLDMVPNHMCVSAAENSWWSDVLENGPSSPYARYFDVDWLPPKADLMEKVLLPILGDQYGRVLEERLLRVEFAQGAFVLAYYEHRLPVAPRSWPVVLDPALGRLRGGLGPEHPAVLELESILTAIRHLPLRSETEPERVRERQREKEIVKRRLAALMEAQPEALAALEASLVELNGARGDARSFDALEALLADQAYRLSHWRVATDEINYRRFFDVNELAALRVEDPAVFEATHALAFRLLEQGTVHGLRIDHVDGLYDPADYLSRLPAGAYIVVEKILTGDERLRPGWPVQGTTGYDFLNLVGGLQVEPDGRRALGGVYERFTGSSQGWADVSYESKKLVLEVSMSSELTVLARRLDRISEQHRYSRDFTLNSLQAALGEVVACFPVYRSYVRADSGVVDPEDRRHIQTAVRRARRRNPAIDGSVFDFIEGLLLLDDPDGLEPAQRRERREFVMRFQQLTGPVIAKGLEDTASYRFHPLASVNEVGGDPSAGAVTPERFHAENAERLRSWPHALIATSTHDTKRDEDVRARMAVLSEVPVDFEEALRRWRAQAAPHKVLVDEAEAPDASAEYLLYQTLYGTWPVRAADGADWEDYVGRIQAYMRKALREAKLRTSWISPNVAYEQAVERLVGVLLDPSDRTGFRADMAAFVRSFLRPGLLNALGQTVLKMAAPGVPDLYQGRELWEFALVDPDNRRPVDFARRRLELERLDAGAEPAACLAGRLLDQIEDGRLKLFLISRGLRFRRAQRALFEAGEYRPLTGRGAWADRVVAFARASGQRLAVAAAARYFTRLPWPPTGQAAWRDATLPLDECPPGDYRDVFTERTLQARPDDGQPELRLSDVFAQLPFALLERVP